MSTSLAGLTELAERIGAATDYTDLFPDADTVQSLYREMVKVSHPDRYLGRRNGDYQIATKAFQRLGQLYKDAQRALAEGRYGEPVVTIRTKHNVHVVKRRLGAGDIGEVFLSSTNGNVATFLKIARSARDNDLMAAEAKALKLLHSTDDQLGRHFPKLVETFIYRDGRRRANVQMRVNVQSTGYEASYTAADLRRIFSGGMDAKHVVWIWRRTLMALGFAHDQGVLHGAVLPTHLVILPGQHGVLLVDWCYSVMTAKADPAPVPLLKTKAADHLRQRLGAAPWLTETPESQTPAIKAIVTDYKDWYPEEVLRKEPPSEATDIMLAARSMIYLLGGDPVAGALPGRVPAPMRAFFKGCLVGKQRMRPDNAWALLKEFDQLLVRIGEPYYPRRFIELVIPPGMA